MTKKKTPKTQRKNKAALRYQATKDIVPSEPIEKGARPNSDHLRSTIYNILYRSSYSRKDFAEGVPAIAKRIGVDSGLLEEVRLQVKLDTRRRYTSRTAFNIGFPSEIYNRFMELTSELGIARRGPLITSMAHTYLLQQRWDPTVQPVWMWGTMRYKIKVACVLKINWTAAIQKALDLRSQRLGTSLPALVRSLILAYMKNEIPFPTPLISRDYLLAQAPEVYGLTPEESAEIPDSAF